MNICAITIEMDREKQIKKILGFVAGFILLSVIFMLLVIPGVYGETLTDAKNTGAAIAIAIAAALRFILFFWAIWIVKKISSDGLYRKINDYLVVIGISLFLLGLVYTDGAAAYSNNEPRYISAFMFTSVICDLFAAILSFAATYMNRKKS